MDGENVMKILLVKPIIKTYYVVIPPIGLGYISAIMLENGHEVYIFDAGKDNKTWQEFTEQITENKYNIIGFQMFSHEIAATKKHIEIIKKYSSDSTIIIGGAHISGDPLGTMNMLDADFGFVGEAELGIEAFIKLNKDDYNNEDKLSEIPNLVWMRESKIVVNEKQVIDNLDTIDYPAWDLMHPQSYPTLPLGCFCKQPPVAPMIVSRGCPYPCTFCGGKNITGKIMRYRSIENVIREIILLNNEYGVKEINFLDDNFTSQKQYVMDFCRRVIELRLNIVFALPNGCRLNTLDKEVVELMERAGFYSMAVGIESGSNRVLKLMRKNLTVEMIEEKITLIKKYTNIKLTGLFMIGYPGETVEDIESTIRFSKQLKLDKASFAYVMPLPGTELYENYKLTHKDIQWDNFFYYRTIGDMTDMPVRKLRRLHQKAFVGFYCRPRILLGILKEIKTVEQVKKIMGRILNIYK